MAGSNNRTELRCTPSGHPHDHHFSAEESDLLPRFRRVPLIGPEVLRHAWRETIHHRFPGWLEGPLGATFADVHRLSRLRPHERRRKDCAIESTRHHPRRAPDGFDRSQLADACQSSSHRSDSLMTAPGMAQRMLADLRMIPRSIQVSAPSKSSGSARPSTAELIAALAKLRRAALHNERRLASRLADVILRTSPARATWSTTLASASTTCAPCRALSPPAASPRWGAANRIPFRQLTPSFGRSAPLVSAALVGHGRPTCLSTSRPVQPAWKSTLGASSDGGPARGRRTSW
jgi:hypothetical protein